jgi:hypothetical protein
LKAFNFKKNIILYVALISSWPLNSLAYAVEKVYPPQVVQCRDTECYYDGEYFQSLISFPRPGTYFFVKASSIPDPEVVGYRITFFYRDSENSEKKLWLWARPKQFFMIKPYNWAGGEQQKMSCRGNAVECGFAYYGL